MAKKLRDREADKEAIRTLMREDWSKSDAEKLVAEWHKIRENRNMPKKLLEKTG